MKFNIKGEKLELTEAIKQYTQDKVGALEKIINMDTDTIVVNALVGKTSNHHHKGDLFRAEIIIDIPKKRFIAESIKDDLYASIDAVQDLLRREIVKYKEILISKNHHGSIKDDLQGEVE